MNKRKILVIGAAMMSVAAIAVAGIYVKRKVRDPKVEAVNLLQQLPDKLTGSQYNESLGVKDLLTNCLTGRARLMSDSARCLLLLLSKNGFRQHIRRERLSHRICR